jgi:hypothetical protein
LNVLLLSSSSSPTMFFHPFSSSEIVYSLLLLREQLKYPLALSFHSIYRHLKPFI